MSVDWICWCSVTNYPQCTTCRSCNRPRPATATACTGCEAPLATLSSDCPRCGQMLTSEDAAAAAVAAVAAAAAAPAAVGASYGPYDQGNAVPFADLCKTLERVAMTRGTKAKVSQIFTPGFAKHLAGQSPYPVLRLVCPSAHK